MSKVASSNPSTCGAVLDRRRFLAAAGAAALPLAGIGPALAQAAAPKHRLVLGPMSLEIAPGTVIKTSATTARSPAR